MCSIAQYIREPTGTALANRSGVQEEINAYAEGIFTSHQAAIKYLFSTYATDYIIAEAEAALHRFYKLRHQSVSHHSDAKWT